MKCQNCDGTGLLHGVNRCRACNGEGIARSSSPLVPGLSRTWEEWSWMDRGQKQAEIRSAIEQMRGDTRFTRGERRMTIELLEGLQV